MQPVSRAILSRYASLKHKKYRDRLQLYAISGLNAVITAMQSSAIQIEALLVREDHWPLTEDIFHQAETVNPAKIYKLTYRDFDQFSDEKNPQGLALIAHKPETRFDTRKFKAQHFIYLDRINDPGNLGTIIRTAAWFGIKLIMLSPDSADTYQPKTARASAGIISHVRLFQNTGSEILQKIQNKFGIKLIGASSHSKQSLETFRFDPDDTYGFVFGSEAHGLHDDLLPLLNEEARISLWGAGESLNLAASTAIFLYSFRQQVTEGGF